MQGIKEVRNDTSAMQEDELSSQLQFLAKFCHCHCIFSSHLIIGCFFFCDNSIFENLSQFLCTISSLHHIHLLMPLEIFVHTLYVVLYKPCLNHHL